MAKSKIKNVDRKIIYDIVTDPVKWADYMFGWKPRPFQKEILRSMDQQVVMRVGRRAGKTETIILRALWQAYVYNETKVLIVCPEETQVEEIYDEMLDRFINKSTDYMASVRRKKRRPFGIKLHNGSRIIFIVAGTASGRQAKSIRGKGADIIIMDEADYLGDRDIESIMALLVEDRKSPVVLWASSTPTGRRGYFFRWCTDKTLGWTEYHFPCSKAIPGWNREKEERIKNQYDNYDAYLHEIEAEFGEETCAWIPKSKIDAACNAWEEDYSDPYYPTYGYMQDADYDAMRVMGVDWDESQAGPTIVVVEFVANEFIKVIHRVEIPKQEYILDAGVRKVVELNEKFNPQWIYLDKGYGAYQAETLHKLGDSDPSTGLASKVIAISFSETRAIVDPISRETKSVRVKALMAHQLKYAFEQERVILNPRDLPMKRQLENYNVVRVSQTGIPQFTSVNEHSVDALMLAIFAIRERVEKFNRPVSKVTWRTLPPLGEKHERMSENRRKTPEEVQDAKEFGIRRDKSKDGSEMLRWCERGRIGRRETKKILNRAFTRRSRL